MVELPSWHSFDDGVVPPPDGGASGTVVALFASEAGAASWAPDAALSLARAWAADGRRVILADCGLDRPTLHQRAGFENEEGLVDAVLYGLSVPRVARPVEGAGFFLVTAGSPVASAALVTDVPRWSRLLDGFVEAGVTLLLYVGEGESAVKAVLARASEIIVMGESDETLADVVSDRPERVRAVVGPPPAEPPTDTEIAPFRVTEGSDTLDLGFSPPEAPAKTEVMDLAAVADGETPTGQASGPSMPHTPDMEAAPDPQATPDPRPEAPRPRSASGSSAGAPRHRTDKPGSKGGPGAGRTRVVVLLVVLGVVMILFALFGFVGTAEPTDLPGDLAAVSETG